jgi:hypothetical protein
MRETDSTDDRASQGRDRGITWTLDALAMGAIMIAAVLVAIQAAPIQETEAAAESFDEAQLRQDGRDILTAARETGRLRDAVLYWDDSAGTWAQAGGEQTYVTPPAGHPMKRLLRDLVQDDGISYNVEVQYRTVSGDYEDRLIVYQGTPGADAVVVESGSIQLQDDTNLVGPDSGETVSSSSSYFAPDAYPPSQKYNVLRVNIVLWRS